MSEYDRVVGPRQVGGVYFSDYWRRPYVTLAVHVDESRDQVWLAEMDLTDYRPRFHSTAWAEGDRVLHQPSVNELMAFGHSQLTRWG